MEWGARAPLPSLLRSPWYDYGLLQPETQAVHYQTGPPVSKLKSEVTEQVRENEYITLTARIEMLRVS